MKRWLIRFSLMAAVALSFATAWTWHQGKASLDRLIHPIGSRPPVPVYGRWLDLQPGVPLAMSDLEEWLKRLGYQRVMVEPEKPEQYRLDGRRVDVYLRGFRYPDADYPAKRLTFEIRDGLLAPMAEPWRIEPIQLVSWGAEDEERRPRIRLTDLPSYVPDAILAVEDKRFYQHHGIDVIGLMRAIAHDLYHMELRQGGSSLTQQLARSVFLDTRRTLRRKVLEAALTIYLEFRFTKPQLLEMYLNQVYWGQDGAESVFGIESASRRYFGKTARELSVSESALLAGMLQSPNRFNPRGASKATIERRNRVLRLMREQKRITPLVEQKAKRERIQTIPSAKEGFENGYFLNWVRTQLEERYTAEALTNEGWRIFTTIDPVWQRLALRALKPSAGQAAMTAIDPATGAIRIWLGGTDFRLAPFDRVIYANRQPGSAFKPFVVLAALEKKSATLGTVLEDQPLTLPGQDGPWSPRNYDRKTRGPVTVRQSLVQSLNIPIVKLAQQTGMSAVLDVARRAGIRSLLRDDLATALGASETTLLELTQAYATLAAGGVEAAPYGIVAIQPREGASFEQHTPTPGRVFDAQPVYLLTRALMDVFDHGTAVSARARGMTWPAAGKTGTSENNVDAWFIGYSPDLAIGVWVGHDQPQSLGKSAAAMALPLWTTLANSLWKERRAWEWPQPEGIDSKTIDPISGQLARSGCPNAYKEEFWEGTEPTESCALHAGGITGWFSRMLQPKDKEKEKPKN